MNLWVNAAKGKAETMSMWSRQTRKKRRRRRRRAEFRELAASATARTWFLFIALFSSIGMALIFALAGKWSLAALLYVLGWISGGAIWIKQKP
jgi:hypothetical protein